MVYVHGPVQQVTVCTELFSQPPIFTKKKKKTFASFVYVDFGSTCLCTNVRHIHGQWSPLYCSAFFKTLTFRRTTATCFRICHVQPFFVWFKFEGWILHSSPLPCLGTVASTSAVDRACAHMRRAQRPPFQAGPFTGRSNEIKWTGCFPCGGPGTLDLINKKKTQLPWPRMAAGSLIFQVSFESFLKASRLVCAIRS